MGKVMRLHVTHLHHAIEGAARKTFSGITYAAKSGRCWTTE